MFLIKKSLLLWAFLSTCNLPAARSEDPWRFISLADWHGAESFVEDPVNENNPASWVKGKISVIKHIKDTYGGELVLLPGDTNGGRWYTKEYLGILNVNTHEEAILEAGKRCYRGLKFVFAEAGFPKLVLAVGDHEIGDNPWPAGERKTTLIPTYRRILADELNTDSNGMFLYRNPVGNAESRPTGTPYRRTSYAYRHKNILFVTVDVFEQRPLDYFDRRRGFGGQGSVAGTVLGAHLTWFKSVLSEARKDPSIKHVIVQGHLPILQPVRKVRTSGMILDGAELSPFFLEMRKHNVDVYFGGEVHANTATKDWKSNLIQIIAKGFLTVDATDKMITITSYKEVGPKPRNNKNYALYGEVRIDKSIPGDTKITSHGSMKLLDRWQPMIYFSFDEMTTLSERPVFGLLHDDYRTTSVQRKVTIQGVECWDSFPNLGELDQPYDAQVGNVVLEDGITGKAAKLNSNSRVAVYGYGPHTGGLKVSYAIWFKTRYSWRNQLLIHCGKCLGSSKLTNPLFTLTLDRGVPALYAGKRLKLVATNETMNLANDKWQHVAISMPTKSCLLSQVQMFVNGNMVTTRVEGNDDYLFIAHSGCVSIGGLGHSHMHVGRKLEDHVNFVGLVDEAHVWARQLSPQEVRSLSFTNNTSSPSFTVHENYRCDGSGQSPVLVSYAWDPATCGDECRKSNACMAYDSKPANGGGHKCRHFGEETNRGKQRQGSVCGIRN